MHAHWNNDAQRKDQTDHVACDLAQQKNVRYSHRRDTAQKQKITHSDLSKKKTKIVFANIVSEIALTLIYYDVTGFVKEYNRVVEQKVCIHILHAFSPLEYIETTAFYVLRS